MQARSKCAIAQHTQDNKAAWRLVSSHTITINNCANSRRRDFSYHQQEIFTLVVDQ